MTTHEAERRRRLRALRAKHAPALLVVGTQKATVVDAAAYNAIEAGAGFSPYTGVVAGAERVSLRCESETATDLDLGEQRVGDWAAYCQCCGNPTHSL